MIKNFRVKEKIDNKGVHFYEWKPFNDEFRLFVHRHKDKNKIRYSYNAMYGSYASIKAIGELYGYDKVNELYDKIIFGGKSEKSDEIKNYVRKNNLEEEAKKKLQFDK